MRVTISKTLDLDEIPDEISDMMNLINDRVIGIKTMVSHALDNSMSGRYVDSSEELEHIRMALSILDKNIEEAQSLQMSYDRIRIEQLSHNVEKP